MTYHPLNADDLISGGQRSRSQPAVEVMEASTSTLGRQVPSSSFLCLKSCLTVVCGDRRVIETDFLNIPSISSVTLTNHYVSAIDVDSTVVYVAS